MNILYCNWNTQGYIVSRALVHQEMSEKSITKSHLYVHAPNQVK